MSKAKLILFPVPIVENDITHLPIVNHEELEGIQHFVVEKLRTARRFIRAALPKADINQMEFIEMDKRDPLLPETDFIEWIKAGHTIGLMSESGNPCIADPGNSFVRIAHRFDIPVIPLVGPSSILLALMASGLNGQHFEFHGYLPIKEEGLRSKLVDINKQLKKSDATHIFIETPYRNKRMLEAIKRHISADTKLCLAIELSSPDQMIKTKQLSEWKVDKLEIDKKNAIFLLGRD